jgi:hypothetical protein
MNIFLNDDICEHTAEQMKMSSQDKDWIPTNKD